MANTSAQTGTQRQAQRAVRSVPGTVGTFASHKVFTMATKNSKQTSTSLQRARATAKAITKAAVAANTPKTSTKPATKPSVAAVPATGTFNYDQRVVANPKAQHKGFFGVVAKLAAKPITVRDLIGKVLASEGSKLTSTKPAAFVVRVRVRHAITRLGVLQAAK